MACGRRTAAGTKARSSQTPVIPASAMPASEWPSSSREPPKRAAAPSVIVKALAAVSEPSPLRRVRSRGRSSSRNMRHTTRAVMTAAATTGPPNPM